MSTQVDAMKMVEALRNLIEFDKGTRGRQTKQERNNFEVVVRMLTRARTTTVVSECKNDTPSIDGSGVCQFALSMFIVVYNINIWKNPCAVTGEVDVSTQDVFSTMCQDTRLRMNYIYGNMSPETTQPHFVCNAEDTAIILSTMRAFNPMIGRTDVTAKGYTDRIQFFRNVVTWISDTMKIYMSFESTLVVWTLNAAKTLLRSTDLAQCIDNRAILERVRSSDYLERWQELQASMHKFAMVDTSEVSRAQAVQNHNMDAIFATLLEKHTTSQQFWKNVLYWDNDMLPEWCTSDPPTPGLIPGNRRKRVDPFGCIVIRRADHWVVQTSTTYELVSTLLDAIVVWAVHMQLVSVPELIISGVDSSVQSLINVILAD
jgi:hypothetical protein